MKKTLKVLCALALFTTVPTMLTACDNATSSVQDENQQIVNEALAKLSVDATVTADFNLPSKGLGGTIFTWESNNTTVIAVDGNMARVTRPLDADATVKLTVTGKCENATGTREFTVTVTKNEIGEYVTVLEAFNAAIDTELCVRGVVTFIVPNTGFWITDATKSMYVYGGNVAKTISRGDDIVFKAKRAENSVGADGKKIQAQQLAYPSDVVKVASNVEPAKDCAIEGKTIPEINAMTENITCNVYKVTGKFTKYINSTKGYAIYEIMDSNNKYIPFYSTSSFSLEKGVLDDEYKFMEGKLDTEVTAAIGITRQTSNGYWSGNLLWVY